MTLGGLIARLEPCDNTLSVYFDFGHFAPTRLDSFRGYYEQLALGYAEEEAPSVTELLAELRGALGKTFSGYKGGEYVMNGHTPVWAANYGRSNETGIVAVRYKTWCVVLETADCGV